MHSFSFFCLQLVYLISVCLGCLLLWASCCDQNLIILGDAVVLYIGKGQWSIAASSCNSDHTTKVIQHTSITFLQYLAWFSGRTGCLFACNGHGLFPQLLPLLLLSFSMCLCIKQRPERTASISVAPVVPQWCKCCNSHFHLLTMLIIYAHSCRDGHQKVPTGRSSQRLLIFYELHSVLAAFFFFLSFYALFVCGITFEL